MNQEQYKNPFRDYGEIVNDTLRYNITLGLMPPSLQGSFALDVGIVNPFSENFLSKRYNSVVIFNTDSNLDLDLNPFIQKNESLDYVFSFEVIEHLMNQLFNLQECYRVLKPGGRMFLTTPVGVLPSFMWSKTHFHELNEENLRTLLLRVGFKINKFQRFNKPLSFWLRMGIFRPILRALVGGWFYVEAVK